MAALAEALARIPANHLVVDGEIIVPDSKGRSDHDALKEALGVSGQSHRLVLYVFDLMHLDGFDLRAAPLVDRKRVLAELIRDVGQPILYSDHIEEKGATMFQHACKIGLEGVISKRIDAPYRSGRGESWVKVKCFTRETFAVIGYAPEGDGLVASLLLARKKGREFTFVGKVGTGWSMKESAKLRQRLTGLEAGSTRAMGRRTRCHSRTPPARDRRVSRPPCPPQGRDDGTRWMILGQVGSTSWASTWR